MNNVNNWSAGRRRFTWRDPVRDRPVWADVWFPASGVAERPAPGAAFPIVVMSHGASGAAENYSWIADYLARHGVVVLGVSHHRESWLYGPETIDPGAVTRLWDRPGDCTFALTQLLMSGNFEGRVDPSRVGAIGHSSGGATVLALGGATLDPAALGAYCRSEAAAADRGCDYARQPGAPRPAPPEATRSYRDSRVIAIVALDPAAGPGHSAASLAEVRVPVLVVGSEDNDFLPIEHHAARYAALLPHASLVRLRDGEGHFVYLNSCTSDLSVNGVRLCVDREGVDREAVHARLAPQILAFFISAMPGVWI